MVPTEPAQKKDRSIQSTVPQLLIIARCLPLVSVRVGVRTRSGVRLAVYCSVAQLSFANRAQYPTAAAPATINSAVW